MFSRAFDILCLIVLLAIVGLRPLVGESFRVASASSSMAVEGLRDPLTWHTLLINIVIFALALAVTLRRAFSKRTTFKPSGTEVGAFILMVASVVACLAASEKRSAMLAALDLMGAFALLCSLVQLFDQRWKWLLGLMVIVASGLANVAASIDQSTYWMAENEQQYEQTRESMWANKGVPLDSAQVELFENRMRSGEASGYFSHSNVAGGYLLLVLFALIGCVLMARSAGSKSGEHGLTVVFSVLTLLTAWALYLTHGNGPMMAGIVMLTLLAVAFVRKTWWENHRPQVFRAAVILVVAAIIGVPVFGLMAGGLPGASLDFRWQYWQASSDMFADHWQTGVGPENFGDAYLQYKTIANSEEVKNPHNGLVQFATEYGLLGLVGCVLVLLGGAKMYHRSMLNPLPVEKRADPPRTKPTDVQKYFAGAASVTALVFLFHPAMLPSQDPAFVKLHRIMVVPIWIVVLIAGGFLARSADTFSRSRNRWMPAIGFGLAAFLLQDTINFAFFVPGARTTFAAMFALTLGWIDRPGESVKAIAQPRSRWIPPVVSAIALVFASWAMVVVMPAEEALAEAYQQSKPTRFSQPAQDKYLEARRLDTLSPTASAEHARWLMHVAANTLDGSSGDASGVSLSSAQRYLETSLAAIDEAIERAPVNHISWQRKSQIHLLRHLAGIRGEAQLAVEARRETLKLYPSRPRTHVDLADCLVQVGTCDALIEAQQHLQRALDMDSKRPEGEIIRRFNDRTLAEIASRMERIEALQRDRACISP